MLCATCRLPGMFRLSSCVAAVSHQLPLTTHPPVSATLLPWLLPPPQEEHLHFWLLVPPTPCMHTHCRGPQWEPAVLTWTQAGPANLP